MTHDEIIAFLKHRREAYEARDLNALAATYAEDCVVESPVRGTLTGRAEVQRHFERIFKLIPDLSLETENVIVMGDQAVVSSNMTGTDVGGFFTGQPSPATFRMRAVLFFTIRNNQIVHERRLYDFSGILLQFVEADLTTAAKIQQALQPVGRYSGVGFDVAAISIPCRKIGGDFVDFFDLPGGKFGLVLGDVAGKGPPAALMAAMLLGAFGEHLHRGGTPAETFGYVNQALLRRPIESRFATALCAMLTPDGHLTYCNAGHNPPFVVGESGPRRLSKGGLVLGAFEQVNFEEETVQLDPGDVLVIFSDGITEALSANEDEFGDDRLMSCVQAHRELEPMALLDHILEVVRQFTAGAVQSDDLTGLVLRYTGPPAATG